MKIGILTQPLHLNYGGVLQNWALQQVLLAMGHQPEMIFLCYEKRPGRRLLARRCLIMVKCLINKYLLRRGGVYIHSPLTPQYTPVAPQYVDAAFVRGIHKTKRLFADVDLGRFVENRGYEAFVVGSDQVWREDYSPSISRYFLDFLAMNDPRPRIAYAASFGKSREFISEAMLAVCRDLLHRFD